MLHCIPKWEEGNHIRDVSRFYLKLHSGLDPRLSYKVSCPCCYIRGCQRRKPLWEQGALWAPLGEFGTEWRWNVFAEQVWGLHGVWWLHHPMLLQYCLRSPCAHLYRWGFGTLQGILGERCAQEICISRVPSWLYPVEKWFRVHYCGPAELTWSGIWLGLPVRARSRRPRLVDLSQEILQKFCWRPIRRRKVVKL